MSTSATSLQEPMASEISIFSLNTRIRLIDALHQNWETTIGLSTADTRFRRKQTVAAGTKT